MAATPDFHGCLAFGKKYETAFLLGALPRQDILDYYTPVGYFKDYDLFVRMKTPKGVVETTFEIKADTYAQRTQAIAIEFQCYDKPSGISVTNAQWWVHFIAGTRRYVMIPTHKLRQLIADGRYDCVKSGGDYNKSAMYILSLSEIPERFQKELPSDVDEILNSFRHEKENGIH